MDSNTPQSPPQPLPEMPRPGEVPTPALPEVPAALERQPVAPVSAPTVPPASPAPLASVPQSQPVTPPAASQPATQGPAIADDVDVIEKEWVDEAQKVIDATKNDPYTEEEAIEQLQVDYMQKRFGMDVQASHESPPTPPAAEEPDKS